MRQNRPLLSWPLFWVLWGGGLFLFCILFALNSPLITAISPNGIGDHRSAGDARTVNVIQSNWQSIGVIGAAKLNLYTDIVFLIIYSSGGAVGGTLIKRENLTPGFNRLSVAIIAFFIMYGISDGVETTAQLIQLLAMQGSDQLAGLAVTVRPLTITAFLMATFTIIAALIWRRSERRA